MRAKEHVEKIMEKSHYHAEINCAKYAKKGYLQVNTICNVEDDTYWNAQCANRAANKVHSVQIILFVRLILRKNQILLDENVLF